MVGHRAFVRESGAWNLRAGSEGHPAGDARQQRASRAVSPRRDPGQPRHTPIPEPFEIIPLPTDGWFLSAARRLKKIFRRWDADAIFVTTDREHLIAATACWLSRNGAVVRWTPVAEKLELGYCRKVGRASRPHDLFVRQRSRPARRAICPRTRRMRTSPRSASTCHRIRRKATERRPPTTIQPETKNRAEPLRYIVCVYDPTSRGRAATAIRTISMLAPRHPNLRLMFVGPGSDDEDLRMQAAALRVLHLVSFLGERDDVVSLMQDAHLGWVVAEADTGVYGILDLMALAIPTVAAESAVAQRYIANGISGALYPPDDSASTAATVAGMLLSDETREAMGKAARTRVAREFPETQYNRRLRSGRQQRAHPGPPLGVSTPTAAPPTM